MATRASRGRIPLVPPPSPPAGGANEDEDEDEGNEIQFLEGFEHEGLRRFKEAGDMAALHDTSFNDWEWVIYQVRSHKEMAELQTRQRLVLITKMVGPLDIAQLQSVCGGGVFEIRGFFQKVLRTRFTQELAGAPKDWNAKPAQRPAAITPALASADGGELSPTVIRLFRRQQRQLAELTTLVGTLARTPAPAQSTTLGLAEILQVADRLNERANPRPEANVLNQVVDAFQKGMEVRKEIEGGPERSTTEIIVDKAMPVAERLLGMILSARAGARPKPRPPATAPPPASGSRAEVVESPPGAEPVAAAPADPGADPGAHRWATAMEALARAVAANDDPHEFAVTLEAIMLPEEIGALTNSTADEVTALLRANAGGHLPILNTEAGGAYIAAVHRELCTPVES